jgi:hypothetical protein
LNSSSDDESIVVMEVTLQDVANQVAAMSKQLDKFEGMEGRLTVHVETHLKAAVDELKHQATLNMEELKQEVTMAAEGYGGTLESIDRRLDRIEKDWQKDFDIHSKTLKNHAERIDTLAKRE